MLTNVVFTNVPNILDHPIFVNLGCMPNFSFLGCLEVRRKDGLRVGCAGYVVGCAGYVVGGLRRLCGGLTVIIWLVSVQLALNLPTGTELGKKPYKQTISF